MPSNVKAREVVMRRSLISSLSIATVVIGGGAVVLAAPPSAAPRRAGARPFILTIAATPDPAVAGDAVTISGRLAGARVGIRVTLWHELPGQRHFHRVLRTRTDASGHYAISRRPGVVNTNRRWYVMGRGMRSRTMFEGVHARVTLSASVSEPAPGASVTFTGRVTPSHAGERIGLQADSGAGWSEIGHARLDGRSRYALAHSFAQQGNVTVRAVLPSDRRNLRSYAPSLTLDIGGATGIHKIKHVVIIMQENRSFDQYFGTYPGADGIPGLAGNPGNVPCVPDPKNGGCVQPFHDTQDKNFGGPHGAANSTADIDGGKLDGFVGQAEKGSNCSTTNPNCSPCTSGSTGQCIDVMGYHDGSDIPNYWTYAHDFVLQDHMYEPNASWSQPQHLFMVSEWSAFCTDPNNPFSCTNALQRPNPVQSLPPLDTTPLYAWTDLTYLLHHHGVSWGYYVFKGTEPDCTNPAAEVCAPGSQTPKTPSIWNPLPHFTDVQADGQLGNVQTIDNFYNQAQTGTLPSVSWIDPNGTVSEHPPALVSRGQTYVTGLINAVMRSPDWDSTAIFLSWDDWGGFYDQIDPPAVDENGYGLRVPGLVISPYAKPGYIDSQTLSHDAYNKFIEDDFLGGQRLNPATDGRPDPRPDVRENASILGDLVNDFNFDQAPRPPVVLPVCPSTDLTPAPTCKPSGPVGP